MPPPDPELVTHAAALLASGRLVAFPTETVYGLGANALDPLAVARIFAAKGRPLTSPLIVHVATIEAAQALTRHWPASAQRLAEHYWPGPLTLVLPKHDRVPDLVTAGLPTVGIRIPNHSVALALLEQAQIPVAAPSANRFTEVSPTTAAHVAESLGDRVEWILDGGPCQVGIESTVLSLAGAEPVLLRPGMIPREELESILGTAVLSYSPSLATAAHPAPGLSDRHYAPRTPVLLVANPTQLPPGDGIYLALSASTGALAVPLHPMPDSPAAYAAVLYQVLRTLDHRHLDWIAVEVPPAIAAWDGISDRLRRAAHR